MAAIDAPAAASEDSPERWLERIVQLRREGKQDEADKALAEFRKRYPGYAIPQATLERVEKK
jgi:TolA-binding protein